MKPIFLCHLNKLSPVTALTWKTLDFRNCLRIMCTCQSICLLQSKPRGQEPKEIPCPWVCCVCERKPSLRFISRVYPCRKGKVKVPCSVLQTPKHMSSSVVLCRAAACALDVAAQHALARWRAGAAPETFLLVGHVDSKDWLGWCSLFHKASCRPSECLELRSWMFRRCCGLHQSYGIHLTHENAALLQQLNSTAEYQSHILKLCWTHSSIWPFILPCASDHHPFNVLGCNRRVHVFFKGLMDQIRSLHILWLL